MILKPQAELKFKSIPNGIFVPSGTVSKFDLVYDHNLNLVPESSLRRGPNASNDISKGPKQLDKKNLRYSKTAQCSMVFLGNYDVSHYGHWLTEGLSRFWYFLDRQVEDFKVPEGASARKIIIRLRDRLLYRNGFHWQSAFNAFGIRSHSLERWPTAFRADEILVPEPSMVNLSHVHAQHLKVTQHIARYLIGDKNLVRDERPLYLSRTQLKRSVHGFLGEEPIEEYCRSAGFRIVYPERLSLRDQIEMVNSHDIFVGLLGSAFHSLMFRLPGRTAQCIYLSSGQREDGNYENIDTLMKTETRTIDCCHYAGNNHQDKIFRCDADLAIKQLSEFLAR